MTNSKKRVAKITNVRVDDKPFTGNLDEIQDTTSLRFDFETALDFVLFELDRLKGASKAKGDESLFQYLEGMREFLATRVRALEIIDDSNSEIPFRYNVDFTGLESETTEEVESKLKQYLSSPVWNLILAQVSPKKQEIIDILRKKEEDLAKREAELAKREAELRKKEGKVGIKTKFKTGKHLVDNILRSSYDSSKGVNQLALFETLGDHTKERILSSGTSIEMVNKKGEGIKLSKGEYKLLLCLGKLLEDKSQTKDKNEEDYYSGDKYLPSDSIRKITTNKGEEIALKTPKMSFTFYEIAKEFSLEDNPGGENIKEVARILGTIADDPDKKALIRYTRKEKLDKGKEREVKIETYAPLIQIHNIEIKDTLNGVEIDQAKEILVNLHPVFIDQIDKLFVELPIPKEIMKAYGGANVSEVAQKLIFELSRALSNKRNLPKDENKNIIYPIGVKKLYWKIAESYMKGNRKNLVEKYFHKAVETAKALGILIDFKEELGNNGENIYKFTLSKDW